MKKGDRVWVKLLNYGDRSFVENVTGWIVSSGGKRLWWVRTDSDRLGWAYEEDINDARSATGS